MNLFDPLALEVAKLAKLESSAARGALSLACRDAGVKKESASVRELLAVVEATLPARLSRVGVDEVDAIVPSLKGFLMERAPAEHALGVSEERGLEGMLARLDASVGRLGNLVRRKS